MKKETTFISPLFVDLARKTKKDKRVYLNLNVYRNLHFIVNNQAKEAYNAIMRAQMDGKRFNGQIKLSFYLFKGRNCRVDRANILSIIEKFFCDALVKNGCIPDDNDKYICETHYYSAGYDKDNGRVEIVVALV